MHTNTTFIKTFQKKKNRLHTQIGFTINVTTVKLMLLFILVIVIPGGCCGTSIFILFHQLCLGDTAIFFLGKGITSTTTSRGLTLSHVNVI